MAGATIEFAMDVLALADDATGALEMGAHLAGARIDSLVSFSTAGAARCALVLDAETRHLTAAEAGARIAALAVEAPYIYMKTDSALRGNIAAEFGALLARFPRRPLYYVPAYPKLGRVVRDGVLTIDGRPLAETAFAADALNPSRDGSIPRLLGGGVTLVRNAAQIERAAGRVVVCDGETDGELAAAAAAIARRTSPCLAAGSGGFAEYWAAAIGVTRRTEARPVPRAGRCLVCNGSRHPASLAQIAHGMPRGWRVLDTPRETPFAEAFALAARTAVERETIDTLVVFGGDTVFAILHALGIGEAEPLGELLPGVPVSRIAYGGRKITLISKAGGFGGPDILERIGQHI